MSNERPFYFGRPVKGNQFIGRIKETQRLITNFTYGLITILISPRRWGKTSLVENAVKSINDKDLIVVYIDMFACHSELDFFYLYATQIIKQTYNKVEEWIANAKKFLARFSPKISFGDDPLQEFSVSFNVNNQNDDRYEILNLPEKVAKAKGKRIIICIDEFQEISEFPDSLTFQKLLRSVW